MVVYPNAAPRTLSDSHRRMLFEESGISADVAAERGYYTAQTVAEVPACFAGYQRRPGLVAPMFSPDGESSGYQLRPDTPRKDKSGKPLKYDTPAGISPVVDVHPRTLEEARNGDGLIVVTEGAKTGDAATSRGLCTAVLAGVWMWCVPKVKPYQLKACFDHIRLEGREVLVAFDSDCMTKAEVQDALEALVRALEGHGAFVRVVYLPDAPDGSKQGLDDFLAAGGTVREVLALARRFDPADLGRVRLSRDERLAARVGDLWAAWHGADWMHFKGTADKGNWQRGHTARDVMEAFVGLAEKAGRPDGRGVVVPAVGSRRLAELSAKTSPSVCGAVKHLEREGWLEVLAPADKAKAPRYRLMVPVAALCRIEGPRSEGEGFGEDGPRCKGLQRPSGPRMRWASPAKPAEIVRRVEGATGRTVAFAVGENVFVSPDHRPYAKRLGPHRGAVLDALEAAGGELPFGELCRALHREGTRPYDVRRRILEPLEKAGIIVCIGDVVRLAADWRARLDARREEDGEIEHAERQRKRHARDRNDYRVFLDLQKNGTPAASVEAVKRTRELRERRMREAREEEERRRNPVPPELLALVARYVKKNGRLRMGLLCGMAQDEGLRSHDVPRAVEALGCRVERLPEFGNERFVYPPSEEVA